MKNRYLLFVSQAYSFSILRPLQDAIVAQGHEVAWFVHGLPDHFLARHERQLYTVADVKQYNPLAIFVPGNWVPDFFPGVKIEIFHGFGIEKKGHFKIRGFFDLYCTHGPLTTVPFRAFAKKFGFFAVTETGWPKMDTLFNYRINNAQTKKNTKPTILYAPTFSESLTSVRILFTTILELSKTGNWHWRIKFHPRADPQDRKKYYAVQHADLTVADDEDIIPLLHEADLLLTDTSSVVSEFLLLDKPVVTFNTKQPGPHVINISKTEHLKATITEALDLPTEYMKNAFDFVERMHPYRDGLSSLRVLDATDDFIANTQGKLKPKPWNLWRKWQARKRLGYYRIR